MSMPSPEASPGPSIALTPATLPEFLLGVPCIEDGSTRFCPPSRIVREPP